MKYPHVFAPWPVGDLTIANRVVRTTHNTTHPWVAGDDSLIEYHVARARGGVGLTILGAASVHASAPMPDLPAHMESAVPGYRRLVEAVAPHGMRLMQQLWHGGSVMRGNPLGGPTWSASDVPNPVRGTVPRPMTKTMIDDVVAGFASTAERMQRVGLDGVEIHAGHGYLIAQFLSPLMTPSRRSSSLAHAG